MDRTGLNKTLLDHLEAMPNVKLLFNHKLVGADFRKKTAWFEHRTKSPEEQGDEFEINFDLMIGAEGPSPLVAIMPGIIIGSGVVGLIWGEVLRRRHLDVYRAMQHEDQIPESQELPVVANHPHS